MRYSKPHNTTLSHADNHRNRPRVALLIETSKSYGRGILNGIARYIQINKPWSIYIDERGLEDPTPQWLKQWQGDGIILRSSEHSVVEAVQQQNIPTIYLGELPGTSLPTLNSCDKTIINQAIDHLWERGFRHIGYVGLKGKSWSDERRNLLINTLIHNHNCQCHVYDFQMQQGRYSPWPIQEHQLINWLESLPKPVAIMACYDVMGVRVLDACRESGIAIPEQVAVISVDNDSLLCELADPPLTSIAHDLERIGYEAAALLNGMMDGQNTSTVINRDIPPIGVIARQSTDVLAIHDDMISKAMSFIRQRACDGIKVEDVMTHVSMTRITLNRRFHKIFGRKPKQEITRLQLDRCKQLLKETTYTLEKISRLTGFKHSEYMSVMFKRIIGQTPGDYRKMHSQSYQHEN